MEIGGFDSEIIQDFLTESGELLEQLEGDLVALEQACDDLDLINTIFRALHTIKGSASFLALTPLVAIAHASETALNAARNGQLTITPEVMDDLLAAVDTLRTQFDELNAGATELTEADPQLVQRLTELGTPKPDNASPSDKATTKAADQAQSDDQAADHGRDRQGPVVLPLDLPDNKAALLEFLVLDLKASLEHLRQAAQRIDGGDEAALNDVASIANELRKAVDFFDFEDMALLAKTIEDAGEHGAAALAHPDQFLSRFQAALHILEDQAGALEQNQRHVWPVQTLCERIQTLIDGQELAEHERLPQDADVRQALAFDGALADAPSQGPTDRAAQATGNADAPANPDSPEHARPQPADAGPAAEPTPQAPAQPADAATGQAAGAAAGPGTGQASARANAKAPARPEAKDAPAKGFVEQTVRVEVGRLETLMNLVGELVLQKNRIGALSRQADEAFAHGPNQDLGEHLLGASAALDRVAGDIQVAVMRTRMQPLDKLFGKYPRLIRDLAGKTGKKIRLVVEGGDTEVDKSVIEELGDPLVHILRNSADHGIEMPQDRVKAGKPEEGTIRLSASHEGSFVQVVIADDGKGLDRQVIGAKAVERGLTTEAELAAKTDAEVFRFIFEAGFSTAAQVSDLSGRGVGMDVVRTNIEKLKGSIAIDSEKGKGTTLTITIPLTVAIMQAMMVRVGPERYAIPLSNIVEIVRPTPDQLATIREHPVMRLRDDVLPLIEANEVFDLPQERREEAPFAVVLHSGHRRLGLLVSELIGQREIVVKPLGDLHQQAPSAVSGATVREDGGVSLIVDVIELFKIARNRGF